MVYGENGIVLSQYWWCEYGVGWQWVQQLYVFVMEFVQNWCNDIDFFVIQIFVFVGMGVEFGYEDMWLGDVIFLL